MIIEIAGMCNADEKNIRSKRRDFELSKTVNVHKLVDEYDRTDYADEVKAKFERR